MREQILSEIRRIAAENGGQPPGRKLFEKATGITEGRWRGTFWARWSEALQDAGFVPNDAPEKVGTTTLLEHLAIACRHFRKIPTLAELRIFGRQQASFPSHNTFGRAFPSKAEMLAQLRTWATRSGQADDILALLPVKEQDSDVVPATSDGFVYLIQSGGFYKIGRSDEIERRMKEIRIALPDTANLIHTIRTDDPAGIEAYWHRRFQDRRANGEWFKLSPTDVAAFRRRRYQ